MIAEAAFEHRPNPKPSSRRRLRENASGAPTKPPPTVSDHHSNSCSPILARPAASVPARTAPSVQHDPAGGSTVRTEGARYACTATAEAPTGARGDALIALARHPVAIGSRA